MIEGFDVEGEREVHALTLWLDSLVKEPSMNNLLAKFKSGLVTLQALDKNFPGSAIW